jgi:hypothetical protein
MEQQNAAYFRDINVDPQLAYGIGEALVVVKAALAGKGETQSPWMLPDAAYLHNCLHISSVEVPHYTIAETKDHIGEGGKTAFAFLIDGKIYFNGEAVADYDPPCGR